MKYKEKTEKVVAWESCKSTYKASERLALENTLTYSTTPSSNHNHQDFSLEGKGKVEGEKKVVVVLLTFGVVFEKEREAEIL